MKLTKALKQKNRIAGELSRTKNLIIRENSKLDVQYNEDKIKNLFDLLNELTSDLIIIKSKIQKATAPISEKLLKLAELKGQIDFYNSLPTKEGKFELYSYNENEKSEIYKAYFNQDKVDNKLIEIQKQINDLQDEIDEYNALTQI